MKFIRGLGHGAVAVNGLLGQGSPPPPPPPPVHQWSAPPLPEDELSSAFRRAQQEGRSGPQATDEPG